MHDIQKTITLEDLTDPNKISPNESSFKKREISFQEEFSFKG